MTVRAGALCVALTITAILGISLGYLVESLEPEQYWWCLPIGVGYTAGAFLTVKEAEITWGGPGFSYTWHFASLLIGIFLISSLVPASIWLASPERGTAANLIAILVAFTTIAASMFMRCLYFLPMFCIYCLISYPGNANGPADALSNFLIATWLLTVMCTRHARDSRICYAFMATLGASPPMIGGYAVSTGVHSSLCMIWLVFLIVVSYLLCLLSRCGRVMPYALRNCKVLRLDKLRDMKARGLTIKRLQELPADVFGNVEHAAELIITSHRWLHRLTCDVQTPEHPNGLRLDTMLDLLDTYYPESLRSACKVGFLQSLIGVWRSLTVSGADVVIFFDFACLPQIGQTPTGAQIPRTEAETTLFMEALPAMGSFYAMYQVLVIPDVTPDVHPYFASGWCYSEFCSAMLAKKLAKYSHKALGAYKTWLTEQGAGDLTLVGRLAENTLTVEDVRAFEAMFNKDFANKMFFNEDDRKTVDGIVKEYLTKRLLEDAIRTQDVDAVQTQISQLGAARAMNALNDPLDEHLDTALHIAVRLPSVDIVWQILAAGGNPRIQNWLGDTPTEWLLMPRCSAGARLCRERVTEYAMLPM